MDKNILNRMSDSYEKLHLEDTQLKKGDKTIVISSKLKLILGWSVFLLCCILSYVFVLHPSDKKNHKPEEVKEQNVDIEDEHKTTVPYEKDAYPELNAFMEEYYSAMTSCNNQILQKMVTNPEIYNDAEALKKKAEFITDYSNITVYTKESIEEGNYVAYVVSTVTIAGVNSAIYDIEKYYIVNGERGYMINNGELSDEVSQYIATVTGDKDIQKVFQSVKDKNEELQAKDPSIQEQFYDIITKEQETSE